MSRSKHKLKREAVPLTEVEDLVLDVLCEYSWGPVHTASSVERLRREVAGVPVTIIVDKDKAG